MIQLNELQAESLKILFESVFDENEVYLELIDIDEVFALLIGGEVDPHFYDLLERTAFIDANQIGFIILLHEWMDIIESEAVQLEFYELANNCLTLKTKLNEIIHSSDSGDSPEC